MRRLVIVLVCGVLLGGSAWLGAAQGAAPKGEVTVTAYFGGQEHATREKRVPFTAGMTAMDAVRRAARVETNKEGTFLLSIEAVANSTERKEYWLYFVNGEPQHVGAAERKLAPGDRVLWFLRRQGAPGGHSD